MDRIAPIDRYWYIYEADDLDLDTDMWMHRSTSGYDWENAPLEDRDYYREAARTGWDGTGQWFERRQDKDRASYIYPTIQVVKHCESGRQHIVSLIPLPDRGEPRHLFYLPYMPFFIEPADKDERFQQSGETA